MGEADFKLGSHLLPAAESAICRKICSEENLTSSQLYCKWEAWALSNNKPEGAPAAEWLEKMGAQIRAKRESDKAGKSPYKPKVRAKSVLHAPGPTPTRVNVDDFFSYIDAEDVPLPPVLDELPPATPDPDAVRDAPAVPDPTPDAPRPTAEDDLVLSGAAVGRPRDLSLPNDAEPDAGYAAREGSGRVEASLNGGVSSESVSAARVPVAVRVFNPRTEKLRYMNDDLPSRIDVVRQRVQTLGERILARMRELRADDAQLPTVRPESFFVPSPDVVLAVGRIRVDLDGQDGVVAGRINPSSVMLESEDGNRVSLDLSRVHEKKQPLFLHPGMVVVVEGVNMNGRVFQVHAVYDNVMAIPKDDRKRKGAEKLLEVQGDDDEMLPSPAQPRDEDPFASVIIAAGPYTTHANLNYEPLDDLLAEVARSQPDVVFLTGPFVDDAHPQISEATPVPFEQIFETRIWARLCKASSAMASSGEGSAPRFVLVPSLSDVHHDFVCPQPAFQPLQRQTADDSIVLLSNPGIVELSARNGDYVSSIGISSLPALQDISGDCLCWNKGDRFSAIASHMLRQCTFYPTFPPSSAVPLDSTMMDDLALPDMERTPTVDVLITPSKLKAFVKSVDAGAVAVNPGLLCRGSSGGTYAELHIPLHDAGKLRPLNANADALQGSIVRL